MKKIVLLSALFLNLSIIFAQSGRELLTLDSYLIPMNRKGAVIGKIITRPGEKATLKDPSNMFTVNNEGYITLKKNVSITEKSPECYQITLQNNKGEKKTFALVKDNFIRNKVIAHRGAWKNQDASQNSIKSLKKAIELGCEAAEFDVWLSSDNIPVLSHDPSIGGKNIEETTAEELVKIPLEDGDFVPSLEQYLLHIKGQNKTRLVLEVKASQKGKERCEAVADSSVQLVHKLEAQAWVDYITFNFDAAIRMRELDPTANILYLEADKSLEELKAAKISGIDYHFSHFEKDPELVKKANALNLKTNVWTVNKEEDMKTYINMGLDYITTDEPELLLKLVGK
ncbi:glycerophosphodiester phosphodiesterase [Dysgonomonas reticulitermitis]